MMHADMQAVASAKHTHRAEQQQYYAVRGSRAAAIKGVLT